MVEHRAPQDDLRRPYDAPSADVITKLHAVTLTAAEHQTHDYYMNIGPLFADPLARQLYAEIASIEEQHVTQYESILDPNQSLLEQWLLREATEAYLYHSCMEQEVNPRIRNIWARMLDYELGQFHAVANLFKDFERRDPKTLFPTQLPDPLPFESNRTFVRKVLEDEVTMRTNGTEFVPLDEDSEASIEYRDHMNSEGSPTETVARGYHWRPGTELNRRVVNL
jgi:hypothetical protein